MKKKLYLLILAFMLFPLIVGMACGGKQPDPTATPTEAVVEVTEEPTEVPVEDPTEEPTEAPVEDPKPEVDAPAAGQGIVLLDNYMFFMEDSFVNIVFMLQNTDDVQYKKIDYVIRAYDSANALVDSTDGSVPYLFPGEKLGIYEYMWLDEGQSVDSIVIEFTPGSEETSPFDNPISVVNATYFENDGYPMVTALLKNNSTDAYESLYAYAVCYNKAGEIVGGGYSWMDFIQSANVSYGEMGVDMYVDVNDAVDHVEVYSTFAYYDFTFYEDNGFWNNITNVEQYFIKDSSSYSTDVAGGVIIKNETDVVLKGTQYAVVVFDDNNIVVGVDTGTIGVLWPGEETTFAPYSISIPEGAEPSTVDVIIMPGDWVTDYPLAANPFTVADAVMDGEGWSAKVTGTVTNTHSGTISSIDAYAVAYNAAGEIVGGGRTYIDEIAGNGSAEVEVYITYNSSETVDHVAIFVMPTTYSDIAN